MYEGLKVLMVGPPRVGKSVLANFFADSMSEAVRGDYRPTKGCRIVDVKVESPRSGASVSDVSFELWDVSGSDEYAGCWPAVKQQSTGIIIVINADDESHEAEAAKWYDEFVLKENITEDRCILFANQSNHMHGEPRDVTPPASMESVKMAYTNTQQKPDGVRDVFNEFIADIMAHMKKVQEQQETQILS